MKRISKTIAVMLTVIILFGVFSVIPVSAIDDVSVRTLHQNTKFDSVLNKIFTQELPYDELIYLAENIENDFEAIDSQSDNSLLDVLCQYSLFLETEYSNVAMCKPDYISDSLFKAALSRHKNIIAYSNNISFYFNKAYSAFKANTIKYQGDIVSLDIYEWLFIDYNQNGANDVCGYGFNHKVEILEKDNELLIINDIIQNDEFTEVSMSAESNLIASGIANADSKLIASNASYNYNPDAAVSYSDTYVYNYNPNYSNYNSIGGDCANFVSQCLHAGGLEMTDGWYWYSYSNRSSSWSSCSSQISYLSGLGTYIRNPSESQILKGNPVYYYSSSGVQHTALCVGTNSSGTPIVNAHNSDRYRVNWQLGGSSYWAGGFSTIQLSANTPVDLGTEFYAYIINTASWLHLSNDNINVSARDANYLNEQIWRFTRQSDGSYLIRSAVDNNCLDVDNANTSNGTNVKVCYYNGTDAQKWYLIKCDNDRFIVKSKLGNCVLDLAGGSTVSGTNIQICQQSNNDAQYFTIWKVDVPRTNLGDSFYAYITNTAYWLYLSNDYYNVSAKSSTYLTEQIWKFERQSDNSYIIKSSSDGLCLDVDNANTSNGTNVKVCAYNGSDAQKWYLIRVGDNKYILRSKLGNCVLDLAGGSNVSGTNIQIYETNDTDAQLWSIYKYDTPKPTNVKVEISGTNVKVIWDKVSGSARYDVYLIQSPYSWNDVKYSKSASFTSDCIEFDNVLPGDYTAFVINRPNDDNIQSNWVDFTVEPSLFEPVATKEYNGHIYTLYNDVLSWDEAKTKCEEMGGHLVTVTSQEEQAVIEELVNGQFCRWYFMGATNIENGVDYKWVTGEPFVYTNWSDGSPDNYCNMENYLMTTTRLNGVWQDTTNTGWDNVLGFICEVETENITMVKEASFGRNTYQLFDYPLTWNDAKIFAEMQGGHLATITSEEELSFINSFIYSASESYYILGGYKSSDSKYKWVTDEKFEFSNWAENEPNNDSGIEHYLMAYRNSGEWNDIRNQLGDSGFVVEFENTVQEIILGDTNSDGKVNLLDAVMAQKAALSMTTLDEQGIANADMNGDGRITLFDAIAIQRLTLSLS